MLLRCVCLAVVLFGVMAAANAGEPKVVEPCDPYYVGRDYAKLITPRWVGEDGVEAVIVLAIDDLSDAARYEQFLRPILDRLARIDGREPVSLMTNQVNPGEPQLQKWLKAGLSVEPHTWSHPCPLLQGGDLPAAKETFDRAVDLMHTIENNRPVAFRMPCCDSMSSVSPRFFTEIFGKTTPKGNFLTMDSSVFMVYTADDPQLPRRLVLEEDGRERFRKYVPTDRIMANLIEDYPYPYVIDRLCWEIPCLMPSDWDAQHLNGKCSPKTVADLKAGIDATVIKRGIFSLCFHPHGWIANEQVVELIDHAVAKHGKQIKFLTFREVQDRLDKNFLGGRPLRAKDGRDNGVRVFDADDDGHMDVVTAEEQARIVGRKLPYPLPEGTAMVDEQGRDAGLRLVDIDEDGHLDVVFSNADRYSIHLFTPKDKRWSRCVLSGKRGERPAKDELPMIVRADGTNNGVWFTDRHMWVQNEDTGGKLPSHVDSRWFTQLLAAETDPPLRSPKESLRAMRVRPGFQVDLAVAEPLVRDPIDIAWGPDGKAWVVEMADYPMGASPPGHIGLPDPPGVPGGRVRFLEDTDNDGRYDKSTVFLDPIGWPTGIIPWRKGVIITAAPATFYAEDTDGDGRADVKRVLYSGFGEGNQQHRVNHPRWGLDNWIHLANGDSGGIIRSAKTDRKVAFSGRDLRIRPDEGLLDVQAGQTQYGRNRDDWGNWFGCNNPNPGWHYALSDHYLRRNPNVAAPPVRVDLSGSRDSFPIGRVVTHCFYDQPTPVEGQPGIWTCICGAMIYRDNLFGPNFANNLFVSDSVYNVVHRMIVEPNGFSFKGRRAADEQRREFLASADPWFRPASIRTGPDGALWICDMYRAVIEHPEWIDDRLEKTLELRKGADRGRIYRVSPVGSQPRPIPRLDRLDTTGLVAALDSPNGWQRDMAQQMLLWRADRSAVAGLQKMARQCPRATARLHALCTLDGLGPITAKTIVKALGDPHPGVRRHAIRLGESLLETDPSVGPVMTRLADDSDPQVRMQLAYSLGYWNDPRAAATLGRLAARDAADPYLTAAVLSSATHNLDRLIAEVLPDSGEVAARAELIGKLLGLAVAAKDQQSVVAVLEAIAMKPPGGHAAWQYALVAKTLDTLDRRRTSLAKLLADDGLKTRQAADRLAALFDSARKLVADEQANVDQRIAAMRILGRGIDHHRDDLDILAKTLTPQALMTLQLAAVGAIGQLQDERIPRLLLADWAEQGPKVHDAVLDVLMRREPWIVALLDQIESRDDLANALGVSRRDMLLRHPTESIRKRAETLLGSGTTKEEIQKILDKFQPAVKMSGDPTRGKEIFTEATCADCHLLQDVGKEVGPDLRTLVDKSAQALLVATLDPNRAVEDRFVEYTAVTADGLMITGMLLEETSNSVTLADVKGESHTVLRRDLDELVSNNRSHMPEGLEGKLDLQKLADLNAFIAQTGPPRKEFSGNKPETIRAESDGSLRLTASKAAIYGPTIVFEQKYRNIGWWSSAEAYAAWSVQIERGGTYDVWFDWACLSEASGKPFLLTVGENRITDNVPSTGFWERYSQQKFGQIRLEPGLHRLTVRAAGPINGPMLDLRMIRLVPQPTPTRAPGGP